MAENEIINDDVYISENTDNVEIIETVDVIEVFHGDTYTIDSDQAFPALGESNENLKHQLLNGRELADQHPITSITGLRDELDDIESLKAVYSNKRNQANYYLWEDENVLQENRVGYFVSAGSDMNEIKLCTSDNDIFGVTVDSAGFIGAQADIPRDIKYGLVITTGIAHVRCESSVEVGDYVVSNDYGYAQKNKNGYKVVGRHLIDGVEYAEITLVTPIKKICELSDNVEKLSDRMDDAETNIVAAMNVANAAYNKAGEIGEISEEAIKNALEALDKSNDISNKTDEFESRLEDANEVAVQAKAIAESAANSAEAIRNEAVAEANKALAESSELRKEFETRVVEINTELDNTILELEATKEEFDATINDLKLDTEGQIADFKKEVEDNYATTTQLAAVKTENADAVAALQQEVSDTYATIESVASLETNTSEALTGFKQEVSKTYATQEMLTAYKNDTSEALTLYKAEVEKNYATQEMVSKLEADTTKVIADYKQEVTQTYATQEMVTKLDEDNSTALANYKQEVTKTYATQTSLTALETETTKAIAASEEKATEKFASKSDLTAFEGEINSAIANVEQKADENGASIKSVVASVDKYSVGEYSQSYGLTHEQAQSILKIGMIYVPTKHNDTRSHTETFEDTSETNEFTPGNYYEWDGISWIEYGNSVAFFSEEPAPSRVLQYWYIDSNEAPEGYEPHALYIWQDEQWQKVNILAGNVNNRMTSMIRQTTDEISAEVANARGGYTGLDMRLDNTDAQLQIATFWNNPDSDKSNLAAVKLDSDDDSSSLALVVMNKDGDQVVNGANIILGANGEDSYIQFDADVINFTAEDYQVIANNIDLTGKKISISADGVDIGASDGEFSIQSPYFSVNTDGYMTATGGDIGGWNITSEKLTKSTDKFQVDIKAPTELYDGTNNTTTTSTVMAIKNIQENSWPFIVRSDGSLISTKGKIGGWHIESDKLWHVDDSNIRGTGIGATNAEGSPAFWAGYTGYGNHPWEYADKATDGSVWTDKTQFYVTNGGYLRAKNANITGTITATQGKIGGITINSSGISGGRSGTVSSSLTFRGTLKYNSTAKTMTVTNYGSTSARYNYVYRIPGGSVREDLNIKLNGINSNDEYFLVSTYPTSNTTLECFWHEGGTSCNMSGAGTPTSGYYLIYNTTSSTNTNKLTYITSAGTFSISSSGFITATGAKFTGTLEAGSILQDGIKIGTTGNTEFKDYNAGTTKGTTWKYKNITNGAPNITLSDSYISMEGGGNGGAIVSVNYSGFGELTGTWRYSGSMAAFTSDINKKNTITTISENYSTLFDNLHPVTYKYNDGTSDRLHTGFIAQEVQDALDNANIDSKDFAGLVIFNQGTEKEEWTLRYGEFIALNTWQIQKAKTRITELEEKVEKLEALIKGE